MSGCQMRGMAVLTCMALKGKRCGPTLPKERPRMPESARVREYDRAAQLKRPLLGYRSQQYPVARQGRTYLMGNIKRKEET